MPDYLAVGDSYSDLRHFGYSFIASSEIKVVTVGLGTGNRAKFESKLRYVEVELCVRWS